MAQFGKAGSRRSKPTYAYAIIGVALVLFLFGIVGWFFLNLRKTGDYFKENIQVQAFLSPSAPQKKIDSLVNYLTSIAYVNRVQYVDKAMAEKKWNEENDSTWKLILDENVLPESIDFFVRADYVQIDSLNNLSANLHTLFPGVISDYKYPKETLNKVISFVRTAAIVFLIFAVILTILVVFSIDNTIRLAMYSNRFLIKTMQMVGATRGFITRPINQRAVINGLISGVIAILALWGAITLIETFLPYLKILKDTTGLLMLFGVIILLGIIISLGSTYRAVVKYLKMKLDDLY